MDFLAFRSQNGRLPVSDWVNGLERQSRNNLEALLIDLESLPRDSWRRPQFDQLSGKRYREMGEIRFDGDKKTYRLFGFFGPRRGQFTLLHGCQKDGNQLKMKSAMNTALERKELIEQEAKQRSAVKSIKDWIQVYEFEF